LSSNIVFDKVKVKKWYLRKDISKLIYSYNKYKYISFMSYYEDGKSSPPRRFLSMSDNEKGYIFLLKFIGMWYSPKSFYRDVDNWKMDRPLFSFDKEVYKIERTEFFKTDKYKKFIHSTDFIFDIDSKYLYASWEISKKVVELLRKFDVMFCIYCSGKKGFQILIPHHKCLKKETFIHQNREYNTHEVFARSIQLYVEDKDELIDFSVYSELRFVKQQFSLDGRNMCPIIPLNEKEFYDFINYKDKKENPYLSFDYWNNFRSFISRGFCWWGTKNTDKLNEYLDDWASKKITGKL